MSTQQSTWLDRRLVSNTPYTVRAVPEDWPLQTGQRLRVDPPVRLKPGKPYRIGINLEAGTAIVVEDFS